MPRLVATQLAKSYPTPAEPLVVLEDASLSMSPGESVAIIGPSGSGKSTLLAILGTLDTPTAGTLDIDGINPFALGEQELAKFRRDRVGFVFQDHHLLPQLSVLENVLIPWLADGRATGERVEAAQGLLQRVGLAERLTHRPAELSGGERQRVAIARALVRGPQLLLADEPTGNLDSRTAGTIADLLVKLPAETGAMLITVTHSSDLAARMQRTLRIDAGRLVSA